ncbi:hypothetical protein ACLB1G_19450 [Oxalobacteraceae bacterium A2-2]
MHITHDLPSTAALLASGGDERLALDAGSGRSRHGCRPLPDDALAALGSATASNITAHAWAAADGLRRRCAELLRTCSLQHVHALAESAQRQALLRHCGCAADDGVQAIFAASGTDALQLAARMCRAQIAILVAPSETGSGVPLALQGRHFNRIGADGAAHRQGEPAGAWTGAAAFIAARRPDGGLRGAGLVDADYAAAVEAAAEGGGSVLLVLTDVSKTGLIVPGIATVQRLQARWPRQLRVLVDACQFRLAPHTVRAYLEQGWMVALTGSKFMGGPTYSGALLLPACLASLAQRAPSLLPSWPNMGLLLRWEAALAGMERYAAVPDQAKLACSMRFAEAVGAAFASLPQLVPLPVAPLDRAALGRAALDRAAPGRAAPGGTPSWDRMQTIFPFMVKGKDGRPLGAGPLHAIYQRLMREGGGRRFQLGQPVDWTVDGDGSNTGEEAGAALRLCLGAHLMVEQHAGGADPAALAAAALQAVAAMARDA